MQMAATVSNQLFALSMEIRMKDSSSIPPWAPLLPALLASLLQAMVIRPLFVITHHWFGLLVTKLEETCPSIIWFSASPLNPRVLQVLNQVASEVIHVLLSEQTSLWVVYLLAPHLFDVKFKLKVEVGMLRVTLLLLLRNMARLLLRLATVMSALMENFGRVH
ncbi:hypothetical protein SETIT_6G050400v2 [Setaria italica]|uniref:Uncharacterized protein n=1 Tax=Setaria italica TaxID=4555 RepID=A0A368RI68_SETIT|nr:hypothetical protein SETIT_6G050400v2 [Setaria italica]